jgi:hypothetical protein
VSPLRFKQPKQESDSQMGVVMQKPKPETIAPGSTAFANQVIAATEKRIILSVRDQFRTKPALLFAEWLESEIERVHR